nr:hypothetical protein [Tanacetum cinerariifolium]
MLKSSNYYSNAQEARQDFKDYNQMEAKSFKDLIIQHMESIKQCIVERARHEQKIHNRLKRLNERKLQIQKCMVQKVKASDASSGEKDRSRIVSDKENDQGLENDQGTISAEYNVFAVDTQHYEQPKCNISTCVVEKVDSNVIPDSPNICDNDIQTDQNAEDERAALANLIANLKLDSNENKMIQKKLKKANASLTQELIECKYTLAETTITLGESNSIRSNCLVSLQNKQTELKKYMAFNDHTVDYDKLEPNLNETLGLLAQKEINVKEGLKLKAYEISVVKEKYDEKLVDQAWEKHSHNHFCAPTALDMEVPIKTCLMPLAIKTQNDSFTFVHELKQEMHADLKYVESLKKEIDELESDKAEFSNMYDILLQECVSNDVMCSYFYLLSNFDAHTKLQCLYVHKVKECECLAQKLSKQTETSPRESIGLNDMVHNYYLEEAKKKAQLQKDKALNTKPSVQQSARLLNTAIGNKLKPRNFNQQPRNWPPSISSRVSNRTVNTIELPRNQNLFLKSKDLACPTCKKCIYNVNHDECILKYLSKVNSRALTQKKHEQSHKIINRYIPIEKNSDSMNHGGQIPIRQRFSSNKSSNVYLKTMPPISGLTWKPTGRIFTQVGLKLIPIRKSVETRYNTNDSALPLGKETHNLKTVICANSSSISAGASLPQPLSTKTKMH